MRPSWPQTAHRLRLSAVAPLIAVGAVMAYFYWLRKYGAPRLPLWISPGVSVKLHSNGCVLRRTKHRSCTISVPKFDAQSVGPPVIASFPAFAFEERSFLYYAGTSGKPNVFSQNLINEVARRTGTKPVIRVGGTSLDHSTYDPHQSEPVHYPPGQQELNVPRNMSFGPSYFDSFANFPNAQYILTVPMAKNNLDNTLVFAEAGHEAIKNSADMYSISVGNEPNLYHFLARSPSYGISEWVSEFTKYTDAISDSLGFSRDFRIFDAEGLSAAVGKKRVVEPWSQETIFKSGLDSVASRIKTVSMHYYQTKARPKSWDLQRDLMNHTALVDGMEYFMKAIQYLGTKGIPLDIAEVGSALNPKENVNALEGVFGAALWQVDFMLYCMSIGINRINMQLGIGFGFAMWQPEEYRGTPARVRAPYYAHVFAADFVGASNVDFQVANIDFGNAMVAAYAGFEDGRLARIAAINFDEWHNSDDAETRPSTSFKIKLPAAAQSVTVKRLRSANGATVMQSEDITWAGESWTLKSEGLGQKAAGVEGKETLSVKAGSLSVEVPASEAAMLFVNY